MKWKPLSSTVITDVSKLCNTSSNGRDIRTPTTPGNQLTKYTLPR
jgi:hypothetical protein